MNKLFIKKKVLVFTLIIYVGKKDLIIYEENDVKDKS